MSSKEVKQLYKDIRDLIKSDKPYEAIKKCELVFKKEPISYMGELLMGAAYQNISKREATKHLRKAIKLSNGSPTVALQGLANCAPVEELPNILEELIILVPEKALEYYERLYNISNNSKVSLTCFKIFKEKLEKCKNDADNGENGNRNLLLKYLGGVYLRNNLSSDLLDESMYKLILETIILEPAFDVYLLAYKRYLKYLFNSNEIADCLEQSAKLIDQYPSDVYPYEWICKIYCEYYQDDHLWSSSAPIAAIQKSINLYASKLLQLKANSFLALTAKAHNFYKGGQYVTARDFLNEAIKIQANYLPAVKILAQCEVQLEAFGLGATLWQKLGKDYKLEYALCLSYAAKEENKLQDALVILKQKQQQHERKSQSDMCKITINQAMAQCYFKLKDINSLKELQLDNLAKAEYLMSSTEAINFLNANFNDLNSFSYLLLLGKLHCKLKNYPMALNYIIKATHSRPYSSECFCYLGKIYFILKDLSRSRKCFEKCISLNPLNEEAVDHLLIIYEQLNEENLSAALLFKIIKYYTSTEEAKHLYYRLGIIYLRIKNCEEAINSFRIAIKHDVHCMMYWESLGDAYAERGSYNSALRVFEKISQVQPQNLYVRLQIGSMKTILHKYVSAIEDFDSVLKESPDYVPALKRAAEAHIGLANTFKMEKRYGRAKEHLQLAINLLQRCFMNENYLKMAWLWSLTATAFILTAQLPPSLANINVNGKLAFWNHDNPIVLNRKDIINLAMRFYVCALKVKQNTYLWYELAFACYYMGEYFNDEVVTHLDKAIKSCQMAIMEQHNRWQNWNLLGVIYMHPAIHNFAMAQHCLIKAINLKRKSHTAWSNLGALYLKVKQIKLANKAFQRAQQSCPLYPNAWIGQALIAEFIQEEEEAFDLFRHCQNFNYNAESSIGYAYWVCTSLSDKDKCQAGYYKEAINKMYADIVALDAINWYIINEGDRANSAAFSFQGFLSERQQLYHVACNAYKKAAEKSSTTLQRNLMYTNLGYAYLKLNNAKAAVDAFNNISEPSFQSNIGLALAYFKNRHYQEAYSIYDAEVKGLVGVADSRVSGILVAMASMIYFFQGEADTKTILYQCMLLKDFPIEALYSACALGILHQDEQLTETILVELKKNENHIEYVTNVAFLTAQYYLYKKLPRKGLNYLKARIHIYPHCSALRIVLANFLFNNYLIKIEEEEKVSQRSHRKHYKQYHIVTSKMALDAVTLMRGNKMKINQFTEDAETLLIASRALELMGKVNKSRKILQRALHINPQNSKAWLTLLNTL